MLCLENLFQLLYKLVIMIFCSVFSNGDLPTCGVGPEACELSNVRSYDGSCNNLFNPKWGSVHSVYNRILRSNYGDGVSSFPVSTSGNPLPNARLLSKILHPNTHVEDPKFTMMVTQFGQLVAHDISDAAITRSDKGCCSFDFKFLQPDKTAPGCAAIQIPTNDSDYSPFNAVCMAFSRTDTNRMHGCSLDFQISQQINDVTSFLDLHFIYGMSNENNRRLRSLKDGLLKAVIKNGEEFCLSLEKPESSCTASNVAHCFDSSADSRINQTPQLAILHIVFLREHNRIARQLKQLNPFWDDETIFQEARKINIAQYQYIVYYEMLPLYVGKKILIQQRLIHFNKIHIDDYDDLAQPRAFNEFSQAAFRYFHTMVWAVLFKFTEKREFQGMIDLVGLFGNPQILEDAHSFDQLSRGLITQTTFAADENIDPILTKRLFKHPNLDVGLDLKAIDIQRGRDHGLPPYNRMRTFAGLKRVNNFEDLQDVFDMNTINKLKQLYENVDDIDLSVGGSLERLVDRSFVGPTFQAIIAHQFKRLRIGDRFFFENGGSHFSPAQLREIRRASISKILCTNVKNVISAQPLGFQTISDRNKLVSCSELPGLDLTKWRQ